MTSFMMHCQQHTAATLCVDGIVKRESSRAGISQSLLHLTAVLSKYTTERRLFSLSNCEVKDETRR